MRIKKKQSGFSLIEVVITFALIGVSALGLIKLQAYIEQRADYALHSIHALNLIEQRLEWFRSRGSRTVASSIAVPDYDENLKSFVCIDDPFYTVTGEVNQPDSSLEVKAIDIEASWFDRHGKKQSIALQTMISKYSEFDS